MNREPTLATKTYTKGGETFRIRVEGGLHKIGSQSPYFTITATIDRKTGNGRWVDDSCGCCHEEIERCFPGRFSDLIAMHLSHFAPGEEGLPMHGIANGVYWLAGALPGNLGERFHGGNSKQHCGGEYREPTPDECLGILAKHLRISEAEARDLRDRFLEASATLVRTNEDTAKAEARAKLAADKAGAALQAMKDRIETLAALACGGPEGFDAARTKALDEFDAFLRAQVENLAAAKAARDTLAIQIEVRKAAKALVHDDFAAFVAARADRMKAEAEACIAKHGLRVFE